MDNAGGIRTEKLNIGYSSDLIRDICLQVQPGSIVTLIGPNGCGKTTLLKTLTGELSGRGGSVCLDGKDKASLTASEIAKRMSVVMTYKIRPELMTCREVVQIGRYPYTGALGILSDEDHRIVQESMEWTDTWEIASCLFDSISDGQKQRVLLSRAICQQPRILILDEPTSFLDIRHKITMIQKIKDFCKEKDVAVLMSLHELEIARRISDVVVALGERKVLSVGKPEAVFTEGFIRKLYHIEGMDTSLLGVMPWEDVERNEPVDRVCGLTVETTTEASWMTPEATENQMSRMKDASGAESQAVKTELEIQETKGSQDRSGERKPHVVMIQGTMSNAGKSMIAAGLCRIFSDDGFRVAPFKSQNMALNSYVTADGLEMGRAQVMQAECARIAPDADMNPILLKPTADASSQVIIGGKSIGNMKAAEYYRRKHEFTSDITAAFKRLSNKADIIVVEGAGSPVEMNLKQDDIVNMGLAEMLDAPVLLVGDIDRGGVFAQLLGTLDLLTGEERSRVKGLIVNKFRGDASLFDEGIKILEQRGRVKVAGLVPFLNVRLEDEDSLSERFVPSQAEGFDIAVIRLSHISNFTDFNTFDQLEGVSVRYVSSPDQLGNPDLIILPGTKNTIGDLKKLRESGLADALIREAQQGKCIMGICGGFQMLGRKIEDPFGSEEGGSMEGLGLLPVDTVLGEEKKQTQFAGRIKGTTGILEGLAGVDVSGYEIHMGNTTPYEEVTEFTSGGSGYCKGNVYGTYVHGFFDNAAVAKAVVEKLANANGKDVLTTGMQDYAAYKESQYDLLAAELRKSLDMAYIYEIMGIIKNDGR
ncbi:MAG: cobyric acid synthase [Lachnospiraceae bacterium]|nr:cobyric acid synthase [Lachnospiraceae bacterium]